MSSGLPSTGVLGGTLGLVTDGILGPLSVSGETPATPAPAPLGSCAWLLDLQIGGRVLRYSTRQVTVQDTRGRTYLYRAGLADLEVTLDGGLESQGFEVLDPSVPWAQLAARGESLDRAPATLRHWEPGAALEEAPVILEGRVTEPEVASPERPNTFVGTLRAGSARASEAGTSGADRRWPAPGEIVSRETWDYDADGDGTYDTGIEGAVYPTVFGTPGEGDDINANPVPSLPALLVSRFKGAINSGYLLIGRGELDCVGGTVYVRDTKAPLGWEQEDLNVTATTDNRGQTVTVVEITKSDGGVEPELGHEYYVGFSRNAGKGAGSLCWDRQGPMRTLTDVALFCLYNSGRAVDLEAQEAERPRMDAYRIDGYLNSEVELVPWFESQLLPMFPLERARTQRGLYWRFVNWWATEREATAHLDADNGQVQRASSIRTYDDQVQNHFTIEYQLTQGRTGSRRMLSAEGGRGLPWFERPGTPLDDRVLGSPALAISQSVYGVREAPILRTPFLWSETTAAAVLHYLAVRDAFPRRPVLYEGRQAQIRALRRGDVVTVTDSQVHLSRAVALVEWVRLSARERGTVQLALLDPRRLG